MAAEVAPQVLHSLTEASRSTHLFDEGAAEPSIEIAVKAAEWARAFQPDCVVGVGGGSNMLVLSRKKNESIVINNDITIVVVEIRGDKVRLGVEAPKEVPVHRREVYDAIKRNEAAENAPASPPGLKEG